MLLSLLFALFLFIDSLGFQDTQLYLTIKKMLYTFILVTMSLIIVENSRHPVVFLTLVGKALVFLC